MSLIRVAIGVNQLREKFLFTLVEVDHLQRRNAGITMLDMLFQTIEWATESLIHNATSSIDEDSTVTTTCTTHPTIQNQTSEEGDGEEWVFLAPNQQPTQNRRPTYAEVVAGTKKSSH